MDLLVDSHCHLDFNDFADDRLTVWSRCVSLGVRIAILPGVMPFDTLSEQGAYFQSLYKLKGEPQDQKLLHCEKRNIGWYFTTGLHPWWIDKYFSGLGRDESIPRQGLSGHRYGLSHSNILSKLEVGLSESIDIGACVGLGESGLDFRIETSKSLQLDSLRVHLALSAEKNVSVILHSVKAHSQLIAAIKEFPGCRGVIHAFTGSYEIAAQYWELGFALGVGGAITYERAKKTRDAIKRMPIDSLVLETDAPDMPMQGRQGQRNSPEYLPQVAQHLADLKKCSFEDVARQTSKNALKIFSIDAP